MRHTIAAALAFLLVGCTNPTFKILNPSAYVPNVLHPRGSVSIDPAFTDKERATIREAMFRWHEDSEGCSALSEQHDARHRIVRRPKIEARTHGAANYITGVIELNPERVGSSGLHTVMHELGHMMGLAKHDDRDPDGLMTTLNNTSTEVDARTKARFFELWDCQ